MVNTLRITSVVAVIVAGVVLALVVGPRSMVPKLLTKYAVGGDEEVDRILNAPRVVDIWTKNQGDKKQESRDVTPPLVKQAEVLAGILNPATPAPPGPKTTKSGGPPRPVVKPAGPSAKFSLVGTSHSASDPDSSFAYIRLQDSTHQWVRKGDEVGHLVVKEIKHGSILYWDGHKDAEMAVEPMPETASLLEASSASSAPVEAAPAPAKPAAGRITSPRKPRAWNGGRISARPDASMAPAEKKNMEELVTRLKASSEPNSAVSPEERAAMMKRLMSELRSPRGGPEDTKKVEDLGRNLNEAQKAAPTDKRSNLRRKLTMPR